MQKQTTDSLHEMLNAKIESQGRRLAAILGQFMHEHDLKSMELTSRFNEALRLIEADERGNNR
jgi:hypothetical protein